VRSQIHQILTTYWGFSAFRPLQEEIILSVLDGNDTLALMPTGGGKSICFQIPALAKDGLCLVISPLISLIKDQVSALRRMNIQALSIISGMRKSEIDIALDNCIYGNIKFLYVTPERLSSELFLTRLAKMNINLLAVDESHCISQWGYDFRPSYLRIAEIRQLLPDVPVLALTATATPVVQTDIQQKLLFKKENVLKKSFARENLSYVVMHEDNKDKRLLSIINNVGGTGIIYVRSRRKTKDVAEMLNRKKIKAGFYHAGMAADSRHFVQEEWMKEKVRVMVATNAFGMGIDKSNVRYVVHLDLPDSPEAYFQEAGRAGRDEKQAYAALLYDQSDIIDLKKKTEESFPDTKEVKRVYTALGNYFQIPVGAGKDISYGFEIDTFCSSYNLNPTLVFHCLKVLELQGLMSTSDSADLYSRIHIVSNHEALYDFQVRNPKFDHLIKTILRSYSSVFDGFIEINEQTLAVRAGISRDDLIRNLEQLDQLKILSYLPASDSPQIVFLTDRLEDRDIVIDRQHLAERKDRQVKRVKALIDYVTNETKCRSQMLLEYFGEEKEQRCGICDYCLKRNKLGLTDLDFENVKEQIQTILMDHPLPLEELVFRIKDSKQDHNIKVIEWLLDNERISYEKGDVLRWVQ